MTAQLKATFMRLLVGAALTLVAGVATTAERPHGGPRGLAVPAHYMGMLVIVQGAAAEGNEVREAPAYITGVLNSSGGFHDHHKVQGMDRVLPAHQITLTTMSAAKSVGYWVVPGPQATDQTVRVQPNPEKSWLDAPLAVAIRVGNEWLKLDNHVIVEYGVATGQLALRYFSQGGVMRASFMQPTAEAFALEVSTRPKPKLPPRGVDPPPPAMPADASLGKRKAAGCSGCHGVNGVSVNDQWPNLAGQRKAYLIKQLKAYRSGERVDAMMNSFAAPLSDEDIEHIAGYYSSLAPGGG